MNSRTMELMFWFGTALLGWVVGWFYTQHGVTPFVGTALLALFSLIALRIPDRFLPMMILLTLALGSCYDWTIAIKSFWPRFLLLALVSIRGFKAILTRSDPAARSSRRSIGWLHLLLPLPGFLGLVGAIESVDPILSIQRALSFLLLYSVIYVYFWRESAREGACQEYASYLWTSCAVILGIGFLFLMIRIPGMFSGGRLRLVLINPNMLGHYCALMAPIAVWSLFERKDKENKTSNRLVLGAVALALLGSGSRGALLSTTLALSIQFLLCYRKKLVALGLAVTVAGTALLLIGDPSPQPGSDPSYIEETILRTHSMSTGSGRKEIWAASMRLIDKRPWIGYGFGVVDQLFNLGYFPPSDEFQGGHIHNSYLEELVNLGWLGALPLFLSLAILLIGGGNALLRPHEPTEGYRFTVALYTTVMVGCFSGIFESWFTSVGSVFCFPFWLSGMLLTRMIRDFGDWRQDKA